MEQSTLQSLTFSMDEGSGEVHAQFNPAGGMMAPDAVMIRQALADAGWGSFHIDEAAVDEFIANCRKTDKPVDAVLAVKRDGEFSLTVDREMMTAWLTLVPPQGGKAVAPVALAEALRAQGVVQGILRGEIEAAFAAGACERKVIARGEYAVEGTPTRFENLFDKKEEAAEEEDLGRKKYADFSHLLLVQPGDALMRRVPPVPGKPGMNLAGHPALPQPTPDLPFKRDLQGAALHERDPNLLVATSGGQPIPLPDGVMVNPVIEVVDVDLGTGSIEFEGTLRVGGDVKAGMRIKVSGDVIVNGTVEAAHITAGGNVAVRGGIVGHLDSRPGSQSLPESTAHIISEGSVQALFMENARVEAGQSILINRSTRQCEMIARDEIVVGKLGTRNGQIMGGKTQATLLIATGSLGASTGIKTYLQVGVDPYLEKQITEKEQQMKKKMDEVDNIIKLLAYFKQNPKKGEGGVAEKVEGTRKQLLAAIDLLTAELKVLRDKLELAEQGKVEAAAKIFYGVEVRIAKQTWQPPDDMDGGNIQLQGGQITVRK
jgi:uncharacterized protein